MTTQLSQCPNLDFLERWLLGQIAHAEAESLEVHVLACPQCARNLQGLKAEDGLVQAMRKSQTLPPSPEAADAMIPWLKRLRPRDATQTMGTDESSVSPADGRSTLSTFDFLAPAESPDELGRLGKYRILQSIGVGGMGMVFLAEDRKLERQVALKVIKPDLLERADLHARFLSEARAIAKVDHDNIVAIYEADDVDGVPYLVMPLLFGESLEDYLRKNEGPLPIDEMLSIGRELAAGLAAAHDRGMIHRDVKPSNVWLEDKFEPIKAATAPSAARAVETPPPMFAPASRRVKILDFGLARTVEGRDEEGQNRSILGTPAYMSPEQGRCLPVDARSDLFSLGCVLYRMATGRMPFQGKDVITTLLSVATEEPISPRTLNPKLPANLADLIEKLLAKMPELRHASAQEVVEEIKKIERKRQPKSLGRWLLLTAACVLLAIVGTVGGALVWRAAENRPGEIAFEYDEPDGNLVLQHGDDPEQEIDLKQSASQTLAPGTYVIRPKSPFREHRLEPDHFVVNPGEARTIALRRVPIEEPCETTFAYDEPDANLILQRGEDPPREFDARQTPVQTLKPGEYSIRPKIAVPARKLWPDQFVVNAREPKLVPLRLVGLIRACYGHSRPITAVAYSPRKDSFLALSSSLDRTVRIWNPLKNDDSFPLDHQGEVHCVAFSPDGKEAVSGSGGRNGKDNKLRLWNLETHHCLAVLPGHASAVISVAYDPKGNTLLSGDQDGSVIFRDARALTPLKQVDAHDRATVHGVAFLPDGKQALSCGGDQKLLLWNVAEQKIVKTLEGHKGVVSGVSPSPDGKRAATSSFDGTIRVWDLESGKCLRVIQGQESSVNCVAYSPDGTRLLSGGAEGIVRLWNAETGEGIHAFPGHKSAVNGVAFAPDGRRAISGGKDRTLCLWELPK